MSKSYFQPLVSASASAASTARRSPQPMQAASNGCATAPPYAACGRERVKIRAMVQARNSNMMKNSATLSRFPSLTRARELVAADADRDVRQVVPQHEVQEHALVVRSLAGEHGRLVANGVGVARVVAALAHARAACPRALGLGQREDGQITRPHLGQPFDGDLGWFVSHGVLHDMEKPRRDKAGRRT